MSCENPRIDGLVCILQVKLYFGLNSEEFWKVGEGVE